jgi:pimeloyl-ACP methyl ester carboxylesterase
MKKIFIAILIIIVAVIGAYYAFPEKVADYFINAERSKANLTRKEIKIDDYNIVYLEGGTGPTILLLHGYSANKDNWPRFAAYLTKDYHVVIPDLPGHGESSQPIGARYDAVSQVERLHKFAQAIKISKFHIAGNSMGGWFSGAYAVRYPGEIISVGLFDAAGVQSLKKNEVSKLFEQGENPLQLKGEDDLSRLMSLIFANPPRLPYPFKKMFIQKAAASKAINEKIGRDLRGGISSLQQDLPKINVPVLILWGDQDRIVDISSVPVFENGLKNHQTVIIKDCGHVPMIEKTQETANAYRKFIKSIKN